MTYSEADRNRVNRVVSDVIAETENRSDRNERRSERQMLISFAAYLIGRAVELDRAEQGE